MAARKPARKAKAQKNELKLEYLPQQNLYAFYGTNGAEVPTELAGRYTNPKFAEVALNLYFK